MDLRRAAAASSIFLISVALVAPPAQSAQVTLARPGASCPKAKAVATYRGQRLVCTRVGGKLVWKAPRRATPPPVPVVSNTTFDSMSAAARNSFFDVTPRWSPELGQSFILSGPTEVGGIVLHPMQVKTLKDPETYHLLDQGLYDESWMTSFMSGYSVGTNVIVDIWKAADGAPVGSRVDTSKAFTNVFHGSVNHDLVVGQDFILPVTPGLTLDSGSYLVTFGFTFADPGLLALRFFGQQNGTNTLGGYNHDVAFACTYTPSADLNPGGQAYATDALARVLTGPYPGTVGFGTTYKVAETKVQDCSTFGVTGDENMIWNPGDLDIELVRSATGT